MTHERQREALIQSLMLAGEREPVRDARVLEVMRQVPRHCFVPANAQPLAYDDRALPIGEGQTISQPYVVASMTEALDLQPHHRVLEIGTGCGYQAAVLAALADEVWSIEWHPQLAETAAQRLDALDIRNVHIRHGDGRAGWPAAAPFDRIIVTCRATDIPPALRRQMNPMGGRLLIPLGPEDGQWLTLVTRHDEHFSEERLYPVRFVPMLG